jgi:hypothetical protein
MTIRQLIVLVLLGTLFTYEPSNAQSGGNFQIRRNTIDGGGGTSSGGIYTLSGTAGQADAGSASGGVYQLRSGFWVSNSSGGSGGADQIFRNGFE